MRCKYCSHEIKENAEFCLRCGMYVSDRTVEEPEILDIPSKVVCPSCQKEAGAEVMFCPYCGTYMKKQPSGQDNKDDEKIIDDLISDDSCDNYDRAEDIKDKSDERKADEHHQLGKKRRVKPAVIGLAAVMVVLLAVVYMVGTDRETRGNGQPKTTISTSGQGDSPKESSSGHKDEGTEYYGGGTGTMEDPYIIAETFHFLNIWRNPDKWYRQTQDVYFGNNFESPDLELLIKTKVQAGEIEALKEFRGTYDGCGYGLIGANIGDGGNGIFERSIFGDNYGIIENVFVDNFTLRLRDNAEAAGIIAANNMGNIQNCWLTKSVMLLKDIQSSVKAGGIAGYNGEGLIYRCVVSDSSINCVGGDNQMRIGAIAGVNSGTIRECATFGGTVFAQGNDEVEYLMEGGIAGENKGTLADSLNYTSVRSFNSHYISGITGYNNSGDNTIIERCFSVSSVSNNAEIRNSAITAYNESTIVNCYYTGDISYGIAGGNEGGITRLNSNVPLSNADENDEKNEVLDSIFNEGSRYLEESYEEFDFNEVWSLYDGVGVPVPKFISEGVAESLLSREPEKADYADVLTGSDTSHMGRSFSIINAEDNNSLLVSYMWEEKGRSTSGTMHSTKEVLEAVDEYKAEVKPWNRRDLFIYLPCFTDHYRYDDENYQEIADKYGGKGVSVAYVDQGGVEYRLLTDVDFEIELLCYDYGAADKSLRLEGIMCGLMYDTRDESNILAMKTRFSISY